jgi:benzylsuccinate CoA-transferase BbsE subunit
MKPQGMLSPYRVLDLADEKGLLCGKLLGDLGADVIKIERPGGDLARNIGPFYHNEVNPERSLYWFAYNTNKRSVTLDIETADGKELFKRLVKTADFVIESFPPGYMEKLELGYPVLERLNPGVIMISITPFGQTGPYKNYQAPGIVAWAMSGFMYSIGDPDRPPVQISHHSQAYLHAGAQASVGAMLALYHRAKAGVGQHVDVSIQESVARLDSVGESSWDVLKVLQRRGERPAPSLQLPWTWECKDGYVIFVYFGGPMAKRVNLPLIKWMEIEGMADDALLKLDWEALNPESQTQEVLDTIIEPTRKFLLSHTAAELYEGALKYNVMLYPTSNVKDMLDSAQLAARSYWVELEYPELGERIIHPGAFSHTSELPPKAWRRAPLIGEHNQEVYEGELNLTPKEIIRLKKSGAI